MSTRAVVATRKGEGSWRIYYRHCDGYPMGLGKDLLQALQQTEDEEEVARLARVNFEAHTPGRFQDEVANLIFPKFQADLEWIYFVDFSTPSPRFDIFRTSCPYFQENFTFRVWGCYLQFLSTDWEQQLQQVQLAANMILRALEAFRKEVMK